MQYYMSHVLEADGVPIDRHKVISTSRVFGNGPVQTAPLLEFFETTLDHRSKTPRNLGVSTLSFDGQLLENSSPECVHKVLMTEFMLELSTSRAYESLCGQDLCLQFFMHNLFLKDQLTDAALLLPNKKGTSTNGKT